MVSEQTSTAKAEIIITTADGRIVLTVYPTTDKREISILLELAAAALRLSWQTYKLTRPEGASDES